MAKINTSVVKKAEKKKVSRPNVHCKCKSSKLKSSKNYLKLNRGQGR
jgi:hypothetical protein